MKRLLISVLCIAACICLPYLTPAAESGSSSFESDVSEDFTLRPDSAPLTDAEPSHGTYSDFITLSDYKGLEITAPPDTAAAEGMTLGISYSGTINGEAFEGGSAENYYLMIGSGMAAPGFEEQLTGHHAGDTVRFQVAFPDDYYDSLLAGKTADYEVKIHSVYINLPTIMLSNVSDDSVVIQYPKPWFDEWKNVYLRLYASYDNADSSSLSDILEQSGMSSEEFDSMVYTSEKNELIVRAILDEEGIDTEDNRYLQAQAVICHNYGFRSIEEMREAGYQDPEIRYETMNYLCCRILEAYSS